MNDPKLTEILARCTRIETRLTRYLEQQGVDTKVKRPVWSRGAILLHTLDTSLRDIVGLIPETWDPEVGIPVYLHDDEIMEVFKGRAK